MDRRCANTGKRGEGITASIAATAPVRQRQPGRLGRGELGGGGLAVQRVSPDHEVNVKLRAAGRSGELVAAALVARKEMAELVSGMALSTGKPTAVPMSSRVTGAVALAGARVAWLPEVSTLAQASGTARGCLPGMAPWPRGTLSRTTRPKTPPSRTREAGAPRRMGTRRHRSPASPTVAAGDHQGDEGGALSGVSPRKRTSFPIMGGAGRRTGNPGRRQVHRSRGVQVRSCSVHAGISGTADGSQDPTAGPGGRLGRAAGDRTRAA